MWMDINRLRKGCPGEIKEDIDEIVLLSRKFLHNVDILPNQYIEEVKVDTQEAKNLLFEIVSRYIAMVKSNYEDTEDMTKFEEDVGYIIGGLKTKSPGKTEWTIGMTVLLNFAGELKTTYDFLIYYPILTANKEQKKKLSDYIKSIFKITKINASILSQSEKVPVIKRIIPKAFAFPPSTARGIEETGEEEKREEKGETTEEGGELEETEEDLGE